MAGGPAPGRRERLVRAAAVLAGLGAFCLGGEVGCRALVGGELHFTGWGPAYRRWFGTVRLDPLGLRCGSDDCPAPAPDKGLFTILLLGDSVTFGSGVPFEEIFSRRMERQLGERGHPPGSRVINASAPGLDTAGELRLLNQVAPHVAPDLVVLVYFPNDALSEDDPRVRSIGSHLLGERAGGWLYQRSYFYYFVESRWGRLRERLGLRTSYESLVRESVQPGAPGLARHLEALEALIGTVRLNGIDLAIVLFPVLHRLHDYPFAGAHALVREVAARHQVPVIDLLPAFQDVDPLQFILSPYDNHPNGEGHRLAANEIVRGLDRLGLLPMGEITPAGRPPARGTRGRDRFSP